MLPGQPSPTAVQGHELRTFSHAWPLLHSCWCLLSFLLHFNSGNRPFFFILVFWLSPSVDPLSKNISSPLPYNPAWKKSAVWLCNPTFSPVSLLDYGQSLLFVTHKKSSREDLPGLFPPVAAVCVAGSSRVCWCYSRPSAHNDKIPGGFLKFCGSPVPIWPHLQWREPPNFMDLT